MRGAAILAATIAVSALLTSLSWWIAAVVVAVLGGFAMMAAGQGEAVSVWGGLVLCAGAGISATSLQTPLIGGAVRGIPVREAAGHPRAAIFHFTDGRVLAEARGSVEVSGGSRGRSSPLYSLSVAPIVGEGWTRAQPVTAWAVSAAPESGMPRSDWSRPSRAGVRAVSIEAARIDAATARIARLYGLRAARQAPVLHWLDDPEGAVAAQRRRLAGILGASVAIWFAMLLVGRLFAGRRRAIR